MIQRVFQGVRTSTTCQLAGLSAVVLLTGVPLALLVSFHVANEAVGNMLLVNASAFSLLGVLVIARLNKPVIWLLAGLPFTAFWVQFHLNPDWWPNLINISLPVFAAAVWIAWALALIGMAAVLWVATAALSCSCQFVWSLRSRRGRHGQHQ